MFDTINVWECFYQVAFEETGVKYEEDIINRETAQEVKEEPGFHVFNLEKKLRRKKGKNKVFNLGKKLKENKKRRKNKHRNQSWLEDHLLTVVALLKT